MPDIYVCDGSRQYGVKILLGNVRGQCSKYWLHFTFFPWIKVSLYTRPYRSVSFTIPDMSLWVMRTDFKMKCVTIYYRSHWSLDLLYVLFDKTFHFTVNKKDYYLSNDGHTWSKLYCIRRHQIPVKFNTQIYNIKTWETAVETPPPDFCCCKIWSIWFGKLQVMCGETANNRKYKYT